MALISTLELPSKDFRSQSQVMNYENVTKFTIMKFQSGIAEAVLFRQIIMGPLGS